MTRCYWYFAISFVLIALHPGVATAEARAKPTKLSFAAFDQELTGALTAIVLHEAGHAVIDVLDPIVTGREEDVADEFAVMLLLAEADKGDAGSIRAVHAFATTFMAFWQRISLETPNKSGQDKSGQSSGTPILSPKLFVGEHSLDIRRANNFLCMLAGADLKQGLAGTIRHRLDVDERWVVKCTLEYRRKRRNWKRILAPFRPKEKRSGIIIPKGLYSPGKWPKVYFNLPPLPTDRPVFRVRVNPIKLRVGRYYEREGHLYGPDDKLVGVTKQAALLLSHRIALPHDIPIDIRNCGAPEAFYSRRDRVIMLCRELIHRLADDIVRYETGLTFDAWAKQQKI